MTAENAWCMAMKEAAKACPREADAYGCSADYASGYEHGADAAADDVEFLPMPPAFAEAVRAEMEEVVGALRSLVGRYEEIVMHEELGRSLDDHDLTKARAILSRLEGEGR